MPAIVFLLSSCLCGNAAMFNKTAAKSRHVMEEKMKQKKCWFQHHCTALHKMCVLPQLSPGSLILGEQHLALSRLVNHSSEISFFFFFFLVGQGRWISETYSSWVWWNCGIFSLLDQVYFPSFTCSSPPFVYRILDSYHCVQCMEVMDFLFIRPEPFSLYCL